MSSPAVAGHPVFTHYLVMTRCFAALPPLILAGCINMAGEITHEEVAWAPSPDGLTHAILIETNGGAPTSFGYLVELHPADHLGQVPVDAGSLYAAVRSDCAYGVDLHWEGPDKLALRFHHARHVSVPETVRVGGKLVRMVVQPGVRDEAAPCGGMAAGNR